MRCIHFGRWLRLESDWWLESLRTRPGAWLARLCHFSFRQQITESFAAKHQCRNLVTLGPWGAQRSRKVYTKHPNKCPILKSKMRLLILVYDIKISLYGSLGRPGMRTGNAEMRFAARGVMKCLVTDKHWLRSAWRSMHGCLLSERHRRRCCLCPTSSRSVLPYLKASQYSILDILLQSYKLLFIRTLQHRIYYSTANKKTIIIY